MIARGTRNTQWLRCALVLLLALCIAPASAAKVDDIRNQLHYSMVLTGSIDIDPQGAVTSHRLDQDVKKLPPAVVQWVAQGVGKWRFEPYVEDGRARFVQAPMRLRLVVEPVGDGQTLAVRIVSARFAALPPDQSVTFKKKPPKWSFAFPQEADLRQVPGTVHLAIQVGRDGKPLQVFAEQVNVAQVDELDAVERRREMLANAAVRMAHRWSFAPPTKGPLATRSEWTVRIPVQFVRHRRKPATPGEWDIYVPGPKLEVPWLRGEDAVSGVGATAPGDIDTVGAGLRLLTTSETPPPLTP